MGSSPIIVSEKPPFCRRTQAFTVLDQGFEDDHYFNRCFVCFIQYLGRGGNGNPPGLLHKLDRPQPLNPHEINGKDARLTGTFEVYPIRSRTESMHPNHVMASSCC